MTQDTDVMTLKDGISLEDISLDNFLTIFKSRLELGLYIKRRSQQLIRARQTVETKIHDKQQRAFTRIKKSMLDPELKSAKLQKVQLKTEKHLKLVEERYKKIAKKFIVLDEDLDRLDALYDFYKILFTGAGKNG